MTRRLVKGIAKKGSHLDAAANAAASRNDPCHDRGVE
jgi:hypothetical protein